MSIYLVKGKGWRYDFTLEGVRHTNAWYKTKKEANRAEAKRKEEIRNPKPAEKMPTDMDFLELVNKRLDYVKHYNSRKHYTEYVSLARGWIKAWNGLKCSEIITDMVQTYMIKRSDVSAYTSNKDLRYLRALLNFGIQKKLISTNPTAGIRFHPVEKKIRYVPSKEDALSVILAADADTQDYLWTIKETMGRVSEINRLTWYDVDFTERSVILYTRKKRGGHLTPRKVPMTNKLYDVLQYRYNHRDKTIPWVFWHRYWSRQKKEWVEGPYKDRKKIMKTLCKKAQVQYFRYHALRHLGASILDRANVNIGSIQRILGHENRTTTEIYLHSIGEAEREAMNIYESFVNDSEGNSHTESHTKKKGLNTR